MSTTSTYALLGLHLESDQPLTTLGDPLPVSQPGRRLRFTIEPELPIPAVCEWDSVFLRASDARPWMSVTRLTEAYLLRMHGKADFLLEPDGRAVRCRPCGEIDNQAVEHLLTHHVLPHVLHLRGQPSLHASAVSVFSDAVVAFAGRSGSGKSTLAASFGAVVCDNCLAVKLDDDGACVWPSRPAVRLHSDSAQALLSQRAPVPSQLPVGTKVYAPMTAPPAASAASAAPNSPLPLRRVYLLEPADRAVQLRRLSRRDAVVQLAAHVQRLDPQRRRLLVDEFDFLTALSNRVPVARLHYRHDYGELALLHRCIAADLAIAD